MQKIHIKRFSTASIIIASVLSVVFAAISIYGIKDFKELENATEQYLVCERSALKLQKGSDILTEQARLYVMTGDAGCMDGYFEEVNVDRNRESAVEELGGYFADTEIYSDIKSALADSQALMESELYAMCLASEAFGMADDDLPEQVAAVTIAEGDAILSTEEKLEKARSLVWDESYRDAKASISENVEKCMNELVRLTRNRQGHAASVFRDLYIKQELGLALLIICLVIDSIIVRKLIVNPLVSYNESIEQDETVPVIGAAELQSLAETYNRVFEENRETQKLIRHEAEHDALTDLLNKGSFDKILSLYDQGQMPFALIIADIDRFKSFNDTYGHSTGDAVIRKVAQRLKTSFRSTDYIFRIGGDEFAVVMIDVSESLRGTVEEKLNALKESLANDSDGFPAVTLSIGVAFSDRTAPGDSIFEDADSALYYVKNNGRNGSRFY